MKAISSENSWLSRPRLYMTDFPSGDLTAYGSWTHCSYTLPVLYGNGVNVTREYDLIGMNFLHTLGFPSRWHLGHADVAQHGLCQVVS